MLLMLDSHADCQIELPLLLQLPASSRPKK